MGFAKSYSDRASFDLSALTTPLVYPGWGGGLPWEPALKGDFPDGNRSLDLKFDIAHVDGDALTVRLKDASEPVAVDLYFKRYAEGVIGRWSRIENLGDKRW